MGVHYRYAFIPGPIEPGEHKKAYIDLGNRSVMITGVHLYGPYLSDATEGNVVAYLDCEPPNTNFTNLNYPKEIPNVNILVVRGDASENAGKVEAQHFESINQQGEVWGQDNFPFYATRRLALNYVNKTDGTVPEDRAVAVSIIYRDI